MPLVRPTHRPKGGALTQSWNCGLERKRHPVPASTPSACLLIYWPLPWVGHFLRGKALPLNPFPADHLGRKVTGPSPYYALSHILLWTLLSLGFILYSHSIKLVIYLLGQGGERKASPHFSGLIRIAGGGFLFCFLWDC